MKIEFPKTDKVYLQTNRSNVIGNLWSTMGTDFQSNLGVLRLATRLQVLTKKGDANATNLGLPVGFTYALAVYFTVAGTKVYNNTGAASSAFIENTSTSVSSDYNSDFADLANFNNKLYVTAPTKLRRLAGLGMGWGDIATMASSSRPHMLCDFVKLNRLYVSSDANLIGSISTAEAYVETGDYSLTIDSKYSITSIKQTSNYLWIGVINTEENTGDGAVIQWDGISAQPTAFYDINARGCLAIIVDNDIPYAMDSKGIFKKYTGTSFEEIGRLPLDGNETLLNPVNPANNRFIHPNGLAVTKNQTFLAMINNLNNDSAGTINQNLPSGIWEFATDFGFTHKKALTYNGYGTSTVTDWGQNRIAAAGGIANAFDGSSSGLNTLMVGASYYTDATTATFGIFIENTINTIQKKGYFVTVFYGSEEIEEHFSRLWTTYRKFLNANDKMVFKYRTTEEEPVEAAITWTSTTTFTTAVDVTAYGPTATGFDGTNGGEVEIIRGTGSAGCSHITSVTGPSGGLYTVTVDETYTGATGTATARFQKWLKIGSITATTGGEKQWQQLAINQANDIRIEVKCCMTWTGAGEFYKAVVASSENIKITN